MFNFLEEIAMCNYTLCYTGRNSFLRVSSIFSNCIKGYDHTLGEDGNGHYMFVDTSRNLGTQTSARLVSYPRAPGGNVSIILPQKALSYSNVASLLIIEDQG